MDGPGIYFPEDVDQAMTHSRHDAEFLFAGFLDAQSGTVGNGLSLILPSSMPSVSKRGVSEVVVVGWL